MTDYYFKMYFDISSRLWNMQRELVGYCLVRNFAPVDDEIQVEDTEYYHQQLSGEKIDKYHWYYCNDKQWVYYPRPDYTTAENDILTGGHIKVLKSINSVKYYEKKFGALFTTWNPKDDCRPLRTVCKMIIKYEDKILFTDMHTMSDYGYDIFIKGMNDNDIINCKWAEIQAKQMRESLKLEQLYEQEK